VREIREANDSLFEHVAWLYAFCSEHVFRDDTERGEFFNRSTSILIAAARIALEPSHRISRLSATSWSGCVREALQEMAAERDRNLAPNGARLNDSSNSSTAVQ